MSSQELQVIDVTNLSEEPETIIIEVSVLTDSMNTAGSL